MTQSQNALLEHFQPTVADSSARAARMLAPASPASPASPALSPLLPPALVPPSSPLPLDDDPELYQIVSLFFVGAALLGIALAWACVREAEKTSMGPDCALPPEEGEVATERNDA